MPNGGSDCCSTCWFNSKNKGEAGSRREMQDFYRILEGLAEDPQPDFCSIRQLTIARASATYCSNHPHRRPDRDPTPIGPVFAASASSPRDIWAPSPDTEEIRRHLLALLEEIEERPRSEYPIGAYCDEVVVWQLGEFKEVRAVNELRRVSSFAPSAAEDGPYGRTRKDFVRLAGEALRKITREP